MQSTVVDIGRVNLGGLGAAAEVFLFISDAGLRVSRMKNVLRKNSSLVLDSRNDTNTLVPDDRLSGGNTGQERVPAEALPVPTGGRLSACRTRQYASVFPHYASSEKSAHPYWSWVPTRH
jgi:hypothetical protein